MKSKKLLAVLLAAATFMMYGCGSTENTVDTTNGETTTEETVAEPVDEDAEGGLSVNTSASADSVESLFNESLLMAQGNGSNENSEPFSIDSNGQTVINNAAFVMIYNPLIYDEDLQLANSRTMLSTGDFGSQVYIPGNRAGLGDESAVNMYTISQNQLMAQLEESVETITTANRAGGMDPVHKKGEKYDFFVTSDLQRIGRVEFTCLYEGEYCYMWTSNDQLTDKAAKELADMFDNNIYRQMIETFGQARFTENGGKLNILFHPFDDSADNYIGFFFQDDLHTAEEFPGGNPAACFRNSDHAIINMNSNWLADMDTVSVTLAHEFQHLICYSETFYYDNTPSIDTWLNEAMSSFTEEMISPGTGVNMEKNCWYVLSENSRAGQSLYNFEIDSNAGSYGAVYLYEKYLSEIAGDDVMTDIHRYWRESYSTSVTEAEAIYLAMDKGFADSVNESYVYPNELEKLFDSEYESFMSKLTLDFYINTMNTSFLDLEGAEAGVLSYYAYDTVVPAEIEGGGRVIVITKEGSYTIPKDADSNLIYIAFDADMNFVSGYIQ